MRNPIDRPVREIALRHGFGSADQTPDLGAPPPIAGQVGGRRAIDHVRYFGKSGHATFWTIDPQHRPRTILLLLRLRDGVTR